MGETPRRSAFRLPWSDSGDEKPDVPEQPTQPAPEATAAPLEAASEPMPASSEAPPAVSPTPEPAPEPVSEASPFLRELVDAMRGVAESSRESTLADLRTSLDERIQEMRAAASEHADDLRRRSDHDLTGIGEWERTEIERVRSEAEQRRDARHAKLERELADHQAASDREMEATRRKLTDYERDLAAFFAELAEIQDPAVFVSAAKRMPSPPELTGSVERPIAAASPEANGATATPRSEMTLSERLAQLDEQLAAAPAEPAEPAEPTAPEASAAPAEPVTSAPTEGDTADAAMPAGEEPKEPAAAATDAAPPAPAPAPTASDALTPIVVKGLGSFGAITSFKQALERVDGVSGVTLSLGPTGEFVYRASHAPQFDIVAAIREIEGPGAGIEQTEGQVLVTIERQR